MKLPTSDQVNAGMKHVGTIGATVFTLAAAVGFIPQNQVADLTADFHEVVDGLTQAFGGFSKLALIIGPIAAIWFAKRAVNSQSLTHQLTSVTSHADVKIEGKIVVPADVANAVPSEQVVAHADVRG
jgi:hypothetical protein